MLTLAHLTKSFGATRAIDDVSLEVRSGEVVAIVGENGAGKTTLMRIIAGELAPDRGTIRVDGRVALVHQHFMLVSNFTIAENLALAQIADRRSQIAGGRGTGPAIRDLPSAIRTRRTLERNAEAMIAASGINLPGVSRRVDELSVGERSKLELIKAISRSPDLLILDEPTAVLTPNEAGELFRVIERLAANGTAVLFISHKLREVLEVAPRIVVMRAGRITAETTSHGSSAEELATAMVGERTETLAYSRGSAVTPVSSAEPRNRATPQPRVPIMRCEQLAGERLHGLTFNVFSGEIVAVVGVAGNGQVELATMLRGITAPRSGRILVDGRAASPRQLLRTPNIGHIPEDRMREGVVAQMSIAENIALNSRAPLRHARELASRLIDLYSIRAESASQTAGSLSGGNQQKVLLARVLDRRPSVIVAAEPTRGLDIAATRFVHERLRLAAASGSGILLITSDLDEAFALAEAIHVIYRGSLSERLAPAEAASQLANLMAGVA